MAKEPSRRYTTPGEVASGLRRFLDGEPIRARLLGCAEKLALVPAEQLRGVHASATRRFPRRPSTLAATKAPSNQRANSLRPRLRPRLLRPRFRPPGSLHLAGDGMIMPSECFEQRGQHCLVILPPTDRFRVDRPPDLAEARGPDRAFE